MSDDYIPITGAIAWLQIGIAVPVCIALGQIFSQLKRIANALERCVPDPPAKEPTVRKEDLP